MNESKTLRIATIQAGLSNPSTTSRLADTLQQELLETAESAGYTTELTRIDVRNFGVQVAEATVSGLQSEALEEALDKVAKADLIIAVTPTFNASYAGIFKSFIDLLKPKSLKGKPVIIGATGGTARHSLVIDMAMRPLFSYLHASTVPTAIFAAAEDFAGGNSIKNRAKQTAIEALALLNGSAIVEEEKAEGVIESSLGEYTSFDSIMSSIKNRQ